MHTFTLAILSSTLFASSSLVASETKQCDEYDVYVMRHLPKLESNTSTVNKADPELSEIGHKMALALANTSFMATVDVGFSTDYQRTRQSLTPSAQQHNFDIHIYDPRDNQSLIKKINTQYCGKTMAIIGHSNTVPLIIQALGGKFEVTYAGQPLPAATQVQLGESDYGTVFHVKKVQGDIRQNMFRLKP